MYYFSKLTNFKINFKKYFILNTNHQQSVKCVPNQSVLDLVLMVDTSSSVGQANFVLIKDFLANIFGNFPIGSTDTRVGMVTYNNDVNIKFYLNTHSEKQDVLRGIILLTIYY